MVTGLTLVLVALVSPLDRISEQLASAHMVQHLLLADLVPIALILAFTKVLLRPVTREIHALEKRAGWLAHPVFGRHRLRRRHVALARAGLYDAALNHAGVHVLEHLTFAASGSLYWWHLISPIRSRLRLGGMAPVAYMVSTKLLVGALGVFLAFYPKLLYTPYAVDGERWGMSPLDDQHVAGLIMGLEQSLVMGVGLAYLFTRMLTEADAADRRADALREHLAVRAPGGPVDAGACRGRRRRAPKVTSPSTVSRSASTSDGGPAGKRASKSPTSLNSSLSDDERRARRGRRPARPRRRRVSA